MKRAKRILTAALAAALLLGAVPALAAERTDMPDYFSVRFDAEKVTTGQTFTMSYGRTYSDGTSELFGSDTVGDDYHYAVTPETALTVANVHPSETGYVYICCDVGTPTETVVGADGAEIAVPGGYFVSDNTDRYYLGADGTWKVADFALDLAAAVLDPNAPEGPGAVLYSGESCTFTLPQLGAEKAYLLYLYYLDPAVSAGEAYTAYQRNVFRYAAAETVAGFTDVRADDYYAEAVRWAVDRGVTTGTTATTFSPAASVTRAQAVTFLWRAAGSPAPSADASPFADVADPDAWYYDAVLWAAEQAITTGVDADTFGLSGTLTYDQILALLARTAGADASGADWAQKARDWADASGLTDGLPSSAAGSCPRADVVYFLWRQLA